FSRDWSSDVCSSDLSLGLGILQIQNVYALGSSSTLALKGTTSRPRSWYRIYLCENFYYLLKSWALESGSSLSIRALRLPGVLPPPVVPPNPFLREGLSC